MQACKKDQERSTVSEAGAGASGEAVAVGHQGVSAAVAGMQRVSAVAVKRQTAGLTLV